MPTPVNHKLAVKNPSSRNAVVSTIESAFAGSGIDVAVKDGKPGALGLPSWTTVWFTAEHGDFARLCGEVAARLEASGIADELADLDAV